MMKAVKTKAILSLLQSLLHKKILTLWLNTREGIVCTPMRREALEKLGIPAMVCQNTDNHETAFTVTVDHVDTTTGVSPAERCVYNSKIIRS